MRTGRNEAGRLEAAWAGALAGLSRLRGYGLLKSRVFARAGSVL